MKPTQTHPTGYQIRVAGHLSSQWEDWFEGLTITLEGNGNTLITGPVTDQAALYGLLKKVRDLGLSLVSVNCVEPGPSNTIRPGHPDESGVSSEVDTSNKE